MISNPTIPFSQLLNEWFSAQSPESVIAPKGCSQALLAQYQGILLELFRTLRFNPKEVLIEQVTCDFNKFRSNAKLQGAAASDNGCSRPANLYGWFNPKTKEFWFSYNNPFGSHTFGELLSSYLKLDLSSIQDPAIRRYFHGDLNSFMNVLFRLSFTVKVKKFFTPNN